MHSSSADSFDRRSATRPNQPDPGSEAWRDEIASRVHNYRARHKSTAAEQQSLALDFDPASDAPAPRRQDAGPRREAAAPPPAHDAFDTNYYRRLNAQAMEQSTRSASAAATALAAVAEPEPEAACVPQPSAAMPEMLPCRAEAGDAVDLALHAPAAGDACLERYRMPDAEAGSACEEAPLPAAQSSIPTSPEPAWTEVARMDTAGLDALRANSAAAPGPAPEAQSNLIVFPRPLLEPPLMPPPSRDELAEPVHARPRILEVPEDIMPAMQGSLFPEIRLDAEEPDVSVSREPEIEIPLPVAPLSARLTAGLADAGVVLAAGALFAAIAERAMPEIPHTKPFWMTLGAVTMLLWAIYQQLFLLYAGRTVGMQMNGIRLSTFDGRAPEWSERSRRARFVLISFASVALGFLWALVDEDTLCWHDRVSRTFPTLE